MLGRKLRLEVEEKKNYKKKKKINEKARHSRNYFVHDIINIFLFYTSKSVCSGLNNKINYKSR